MRRVANKWVKFQVLNQHTGVARHIPEMRRYSAAALGEMLRRYGYVVVKPLVGTGGSGVVKVERVHKGHYRYHYRRTRKSVYSMEALVHRINRIRCGRGYMIQRGIHLATIGGRPVDYRVKMIKEGSRWRITAVVARIARKGQFVTNLSSGYANRKQHYTPNNIEVIDGYLNLHILQEDSHGFPYTSGAVTTRDKVNFMHGRLEIRAKLPKGKGFRPAIRMLPASGQSFPEINVAEIDGARPDELYNLAHQYADGKHEREYKKSSVEDISDDFHIYSIEWTEDSITYLLDNSELFTAKAIVPQEPMYLDLYVGVGGDWVQDPDHTTAFPNVMQVDYIRYYR